MRRFLNLMKCFENNIVIADDIFLSLENGGEFQLDIDLFRLLIIKISLTKTIRVLYIYN